MSILLEWPSEIVESLSKEADRRGLSLDSYLLQIAHREVHEESLSEAEQQARREKAAASIRELRRGNILGPT